MYLDRKVLQFLGHGRFRDCLQSISTVGTQCSSRRIGPKYPTWHCRERDNDLHMKDHQQIALLALLSWIHNARTFDSSRMFVPSLLSGLIKHIRLKFFENCTSFHLELDSWTMLSHNTECVRDIRSYFRRSCEGKFPSRVVLTKFIDIPCIILHTWKQILTKKINEKPCKKA